MDGACPTPAPTNQAQQRCILSVRRPPPVSHSVRLVLDERAETNERVERIERTDARDDEPGERQLKYSLSDSVSSCESRHEW